MIDITMPRLSDTMEEGVVLNWLKRPGDTVEAGEALVDIETDKAVMEFEAYESGVLSRVLVEEGERVAIGTVIAELLEPGEMAPSPEEAATDGVAGGADEQESAAQPALARPTSAQPAADQPVPDRPAHDEPVSDAAWTRRPDRLLATPLVRRFAREHRLVLDEIAGSGPGGRIIRADVERLLVTGVQPVVGESAGPAAREVAPDFAVATDVPVGQLSRQASPVHDRREPEEVPFDSVRRVIAHRLSDSSRDVPHFVVTAVADVEELVQMRAELNQRLQAADREKVSVNDILVRACALALRAHPHVNASFRSNDAATMFVHRRVHVGVAVASRTGLVVPVIDDADRKTVTDIGLETRRLVASANARKLTPEQMSGGTFTISNLGMFGVEQFTAIINPPQGAILAVGATVREPVAVGDGVAIRHRMRLSLAADHRIIDGALAARFLQTLTGLLEQPWTILA
ncbi:pyruvate dehydrogenase complex dihydrolipoamide acetyltransferase [Microlunatus lacustris]